MYVLLCDECILSCLLLTFYTYTISCDGITLLYICPILTLSPLLNSETLTKNPHFGTRTRYIAEHGKNKYSFYFTVQIKLIRKCSSLPFIKLLHLISLTHFNFIYDTFYIRGLIILYFIKHSCIMAVVVTFSSAFGEVYSLLIPRSLCNGLRYDRINFVNYPGL